MNRSDLIIASTFPDNLPTSPPHEQRQRNFAERITEDILIGNFNDFDARNNPNLTCIEVDDEVWSTANWTNIDTQTSFSEDCSAMNVDEFNDSVFSMYPNPVSDELIIDFNEEASYSIVNLNGQILNSGKINQKGNTINVNRLSSGVYFVRVKTDKGIITKKLIKQ